MKRFSGMFGAFSILALVTLVSGCATTLGQTIMADVGGDIGKGLVTHLVEIRDNDLFKMVAQDAKATRAWAESQFGMTGKTPDVLKYRLATACPDATDAVGDLIQKTVNDMIAQVEIATAPPDPNAPRGFAMLLLTQLKYGDAPNPRAKIATLRKALALQTDALFTGCAHLFPKRQMNDLALLLLKAGVAP